MLFDSILYATNNHLHEYRVFFIMKGTTFTTYHTYITYITRKVFYRIYPLLGDLRIFI